jgi:hypothetical protein
MIPQSLSSSLSYLVPSLQFTVPYMSNCLQPWTYSTSLLSLISLGNPNFSSFRFFLAYPWEIDLTVTVSMQLWFPLHWSRSDCCRRKDHSNAEGELHRGNGSLCKDFTDRAIDNIVAKGLK